MATRDIQINTTGLIIEVLLRSTNGSFATNIPASSVTFSFTREGDTVKGYGTCTTTSLNTWASGGWVQIDATNHKGKYQFGVPNTAIASGAVRCSLTFTGSNFIDKSEEIRLYMNNPQASVVTIPINLKR